MLNEFEKYEIDCYADIIADKNIKESFDHFTKTIDTRNRKVIGSPHKPEGVPTAAIAALAAGLGGAGWVVFGVTAAISIGVMLYMLSSKKKEEKESTTYYNPTYGFESVAELTQYGEVIPVIYGKRGVRITQNTSDGNPFGGVRVGGKLINSRVETINGQSVMYNLYAISLGEIEEILELESYINDEPIKDLTDDIEIFWTNGTTDQVPIEIEGDRWFLKQSQTVQINNNNTCSCHKIIDVKEIETVRVNDDTIVTPTPEYPYVITTNLVARAYKEETFYKECNVLTVDPSVNQENERINSVIPGATPGSYNPLDIPIMSSDTGEITRDMIVRKPRYKPLTVWDKPIAFETKLTGKGSYFEFELAETGLPVIVALSSDRPGNAISSYKYPKIGGRVDYWVDTHHTPIINAVAGIGVYLDGFDYLDDITETPCNSDDVSWTTHASYPFRWQRINDRSKYWYIPDIRISNSWVNSEQVIMAAPYKYRIWISDEGNIEYWVNYGGASEGWSQLSGVQTIPYDDPTTPHLTQPPYTVWLYTNYPGAGIKNLVWSNYYDSEVGSIDGFTRTTEETEIEVTESSGDESSAYDIQKFNTTDIYQICDSSYVVAEEFKVKRKDAVNQKIVANKVLQMNDEDISEIWKINRLRMTTTKKVTDININLAMILYARYKPESDGGQRAGKK
jgi:hypothetical protein